MNSLIPKSLSFLCKADLSMPTNFAVLDILPLNFFSCEDKYSLSKFSLASFKGAWKDWDKIFCSSKIFYDGFSISSINWLIFSLLSLDDKIVILSIKFLNSLTLPGQLYVYKLSFLISISGSWTPLISESFFLKYG